MTLVFISSDVRPCAMDAWPLSGRPPVGAARAPAPGAGQRQAPPTARGRVAEPREAVAHRSERLQLLVYYATQAYLHSNRLALLLLP